MAPRTGAWRLTLPPGPIVPGVTAAMADSAWLRGEVPAPTPQPRDLTDAEADALWARPVRATRRPADDEIHRALFSDTTAATPADAANLGW